MAQQPSKDAPTKAKDKETKAVVMPKPTSVGFLKSNAEKGGKDRAEVAQKTLKEMVAKGITKNSKGKLVTEATLLSLLGAMCRDINAPRKGWWSLFEVKETDTEFKFVKKPQ